MSVADSLYNLQLVQDFCASHLPRGCPLSLEDLLYVPPPLKVRSSWECGGEAQGLRSTSQASSTSQLTSLWPAGQSGGAVG